MRKEVELAYTQKADHYINERVTAREQQLQADFELELARRLAVALTGRSDAVPQIEMKDESQSQMDAMQKNDLSVLKDANGRMGTRKHPLHFGKVQAGPNYI